MTEALLKAVALNKKLQSGETPHPSEIKALEKTNADYIREKIGIRQEGSVWTKIIKFRLKDNIYINFSGLEKGVNYVIDGLVWVSRDDIVAVVILRRKDSEGVRCYWVGQDDKEGNQLVIKTRRTQTM